MRGIRGVGLILLIMSVLNFWSCGSFLSEPLKGKDEKIHSSFEHKLRNVSPLLHTLGSMQFDDAKRIRLYSALLFTDLLGANDHLSMITYPGSDVVKTEFQFNQIMPSLAANHSQQTAQELQHLSVVLLLDASGSMKKTDPDGFRKLASQAVVSLLSAEDRIAIVEFDSDARVISNWKSAADKSSIFNLLNQIGNSGSFTDFRAGLEIALQVFRKEPSDSKKVILLLSDGVFEPNPLSEKYAPYNLQYRMESRGKNKTDMRQINEAYRKILSPVARRMIENDLLPLLKKEGIEVYSVGFSEGADREILNDLADASSKSKTEAHYFYANNAIDLMETFVGLLHFWKNKIVLKSEKGHINASSGSSIPIDAYLREVSIIALTEQPADFYAKPAGGTMDEPLLEGTHSNLKVVMLMEKLPPGLWNYGFRRGSGSYRLLAVGKSTLDLLITGIKEKYSYGEPVKASAYIQINGQDGRPYLMPNPRVVAEIAFGTSKEGPVDLQEGREAFLYNYVVKSPGKVRIKFTLLAKDKEGNDLLPRPSKEYVTEIMPRFYVEPPVVNFGDLSQGKHQELTVKVHSGLDSDVKINVLGNIRSASRCRDAKDKLPIVKFDAFELRTGQSLDRSLSLSIPEKGCWGDFEGDIFFESDKGERAGVAFRVHVPSIWEKLTWFVLAIIILLAIALFLLALYWGYLKSPVGVLRPVRYPPGTAILSDIKLSSLKRGFGRRFLHWRKNVITIGQAGADLKLSGLPNNMKVELIFHQFGADYIKNVSPASSEQVLTVSDPDVGIPIDRLPGVSYRLSHGLNIKIGDYELIYENIK